MKQLIPLLIILLFVSCDNGAKKILVEENQNKTKTISVLVDSVLALPYKLGFTHKNISNGSDRRVDMLYNGAEGCFGGSKNPKVNFFSECLSCEPIQEFEGGLLFAKRLLITNTEIKYYKKDFTY